MILPKKFFQQKTLTVARNLLGCFLVRKAGKKIIRGKITEVEAYIGKQDLASHASRGRTPRTELMFGAAGYSYIYMIYGMYHCLNVVTEKKNFPAAVLIRSVKVAEIDKEKTNGPGKVCRLFKIDRKLNGRDLTRKRELWIEKGEKVQKSKIKKGKRIGVDYAKHCKDYPWRFFIE